MISIKCKNALYTDLIPYRFSFGATKTFLNKAHSTISRVVAKSDRKLNKCLDFLPSSKENKKFLKSGSVKLFQLEMRVNFNE